MRILIIILSLFLSTNLYSQESKLAFDIYQNLDEDATLKNGRLFLVFSKNKPTEIFSGIQYPDLNMNPIFGVDVFKWEKDVKLHIKGDECYGFPIKQMNKIPDGNWHVYAVFKKHNKNPIQYEEERIYSEPVLINISPINGLQKIELNLNKRLSLSGLPTNSKYYKYETVSSNLLTEFWKKNMSIRCQVILPSTYYTETKREYPILILIGGFGERYYNKVISEKDLLSQRTPQMIIIMLDSKAPFGDSYQINSVNNGPYGDALVKEVIPFIESKYRCLSNPNSRFLTGTSTGGWSSLALQIFYPDFFNGVWSTCSDPVDFRQMELINIYEDKNAFVNKHGLERPAMRDINGEPRYSLRTEVWAENLTGTQNSYHTSGGQWGSWNAVFSPKDTFTGSPKVLFDAETGIIDKDIAEAWKKYDLRLHLSENWERIGLKLQGKLHIWMGTADSYYLNNAMVLLDRFLKTTSNPKSDAEVHFICGEGHACDSEIPLELMMQQMVDRYEKSK